MLSCYLEVIVTTETPPHPKAGSRNPPIYKDGYRYAIDENGCAGVPEGHGQGAEIDWDFIYGRGVSGTEIK